MGNGYDVIVVGGGHNGLVAAGLLARQGLRTVVLERRGIVGGAAVSEHPFGPDYTVTSLSYVVSLFPPSLVRDLQLDRHGYHVYPQGPYFAPQRDGRYLQLPSDRAARREQIEKFSSKDADAIEVWDRRLDEIGRVLGPLLNDIPPKVGSHRPADLARQAMLLRRLRGVDERKAVDHHPADDLERRRPGRGPVRVRRHARRARRLRGHRHLGRPAVGRHRVRHAAPPHRRHRRRADRCLGLPARRHGRGHAGAGERGPVLRRRDPDRGTGRAHHHPGRIGDRRRARVRRGAHRADRRHAPRTRRSRSCGCSTAATCRPTSSRRSRPGRAAAARSRSTSRSTGCPSSPAGPGSTRRCTAARSCWPSRWTTSRARSRRP